MIFFDCETAPTTDEPLLDLLYDTIRVPGNIKDPDKIAANIEKQKDGFVNKTAVKPVMAQITHICAALDGGNVIHFPNAGDGEPSMLTVFASWLAVNGGAEYGLCGWNIRDFDIPLAASAYCRNGMPVPSIIRSNLGGYMARGSYDLMRVLGGERQQTVAMAFGLNPRTDLVGAGMLKLWADGDYQAIADHCEDDVRCSREIFKRLYGELA